MLNIKINDDVLTRIAFPLHVLGEVLDSEYDQVPPEKVNYYRKKFIAQYLLDCSVGDDRLDNDVYIDALQDDIRSLMCCESASTTGA